MQQNICGGLETGCRFQLKENKKGLIQKNEENKKLYHLGDGERIEQEIAKLDSMAVNF